MKTIKSVTSKILIVALLLSLVSCEKWNLIDIRGEGPIVSENFEFTTVEGITLEIPANVYLTQGNEQSIRVEAQQNILDNMLISNTNSVLKISFDENVSRCEDIKIYMTIENLKKINLTGSGDISSDSEFNGVDNLDIYISGSGNVNVRANATDVNMDISGSGKISLVTECESLYANISGSGDINLLGGTATTADFSTSGSGNIRAYTFGVEICEINISGSGDDYVNIADRLIVRITGSGNVYYLGNPLLSVNVMGSGNVINAN